MTDHQYRVLPRFANSDLSELSGKTMRAKPETLHFGSLFHQLVLEPHKSVTVQLPEYQITTLLRMQETVRQDDELYYMIHRAEKEVVRQWECTHTGLPLKARLDAVVMPRKRHIIDLKTTSCSSQSAFVESITSYDYDRQAAFYLSSDADAEYFEFVGVQKVKPYELFRVSYHYQDQTIIKGRLKMHYLLEMAAMQYKNEKGWRPSSWSRKPDSV